MVRPFHQSPRLCIIEFVETLESFCTPTLQILLQHYKTTLGRCVPVCDDCVYEHVLLSKVLTLLGPQRIIGVFSIEACRMPVFWCWNLNLNLGREGRGVNNRGGRREV